MVLRAWPSVRRASLFYKSYIPLGEAEPEDMTRPKVASRGEVARGLRPSGGATSYSPRYAGPLPPPIAPGILCSSRNSNCRFNHFSTPTRTQPTATQLQPFHNHFPNHPTTTLQPSFVSNPRSTRSRHNHPTSCPKTVQQSSPYTLCPDPHRYCVIRSHVETLLMYHRAMLLWQSVSNLSLIENLSNKREYDKRN